MLRVLHVISSLDLRAGGPVVALHGLVKAQIAQGLGVRIIATFSLPFDDTEPRELRKLGADVVMVGPTRGVLHQHPSMRDALESAVAEADILHIHAVWEEIQHQAAVVARRSNTPYIVRPCGMLDPWQLKRKWLRKAFYLRWRLKTDLNGAAALHFTSEQECRHTAPLRLNARAIVEANGVQLPSLLQASPSRFRQRFGLRPEEQIVLFLGRLHPKKGLDLLIPAFAESNLSNVRLVLAGPDSDNYRAEVEGLIAKHDLRNRVVFTGMLHGDDKLDAFVAADLFVLPSYQENFGNAVVEALAAGTPVIISDQVNIYEAIHAAQVGGVVPTRIDALSRELTRWMTDGELRRCAAERAHEFVTRNYLWPNIARRWTLQYESLLKANPLVKPSK